MFILKIKKLNNLLNLNGISCIFLFFSEFLCNKKTITFIIQKRNICVNKVIFSLTNRNPHKVNGNYEEAVSPVIGVILMVAITVILAAVIAAYVFGMAGGIQKTKTVVVIASKPDTGHISVTYQGGQDAPLLNSINVTVISGTGVPVTYSPSLNGLGYMNSGTNSLSIGCYTTITATSFSGFSGENNHVTAIGNFNEGTQQVLLDTYI